MNDDAVTVEDAPERPRSTDAAPAPVTPADPAPPPAPEPEPIPDAGEVGEGGSIPVEPDPTVDQEPTA